MSCSSDVTSHAKQLPGNPFGNLQSSAPEGIPLNLATLGGEGSHPGSEPQEVTLTGEVDSSKPISCRPGPTDQVEH